EIFPGTTDAGHLRLASEFAFCTDFAGDAGYFAGERVQLIDHRIDRVFQFENFTFDVDCNFAGEIAAGYSGRDFGDVTHLGGQVAGHEVYVVGEIFPSTSDVGDLRLSAQLSFGSYFAGHARDFGGENTELLNHRVDEVGGTQELAFEGTSIDVEPNGLRQVALSNGGDGTSDFCRGAE